MRAMSEISVQTANGEKSSFPGKFIIKQQYSIAVVLFTKTVYIY